MYASTDFHSKREFKRAVAAGAELLLYSPELGTPAINGVETVVGPWFPRVWHGKQKQWSAKVRVQDMRVVEVH